MDEPSRTALLVATDTALGGRWTSLRGAGREWLWTNPDRAVVAKRLDVDETSVFPDAGGGEECFPCVREPFDHGLMWNRPWNPTSDGWERVEADGYRLARRISHADGAVLIDYEADAESPREVLHATHLLLDLSRAAELHPAAHGEVTFWDPRPDAEIDELGGVAAFIRSLGDGGPGAVCYSLQDCRQASVVDGDDALRLTLSSPTPDLPLGFVVWRNLEGWPPEAPYRSIGIEPAVGRGISLPSSYPGGAVIVGPADPIRWRLQVEAFSLRV